MKRQTHQEGPNPVDPSLVEAYRQALFDVVAPEGTVTFAVGAPPRGPAPAAGLAAHRLTVVTAYNPGAARPSAEVNTAAHHALHRHLKTLGRPFFPALGYSPDHAHEEPSFAVLDLDEPAAVALGRRFSQAAVYYWNGHDGTILWCP